MAFKPADRFGYEIVLPFREGVSYRIPSPGVEVGNFMIESAQLSGQRVALLLEAQVLAEALDEAQEAGNEDEAARVQAELTKTQDAILTLNERLTIPDEVQGSYFESILGPAYLQMVENKEPFELVKLAASTVSVWVLQGREEAEDYWNSGGRRPRPRKAPTDRKRKRQRSGR